MCFQDQEWMFMPKWIGCFWDPWTASYELKPPNRENHMGNYNKLRKEGKDQHDAKSIIKHAYIHIWMKYIVNLSAYYIKACKTLHAVCWNMLTVIWNRGEKLCLLYISYRQQWTGFLYFYVWIALNLPSTLVYWILYIRQKQKQ